MQFYRYFTVMNAVLPEKQHFVHQQASTPGIQRCTVNRYRYRRRGKKLFTVTENLTILPVKSVSKQLGTVLVLRNESFI